MTNEYLRQVAKTTAQGDAREESYYGHFSSLLSEFSRTIGKKQTQITVLPKKTEGGNPDFRVWDGRQHIVGYIEAKKPGERLDLVENTEQLQRYRNIFPNLILTDFYTFRLYRNGKLVDEVTIGSHLRARNLVKDSIVENEKNFTILLDKFFAFSLPNVLTAEVLAIELAKRTRFLRDEVIVRELEEETEGKGKIFGFYLAFKQYLLANLTQADFADIYAQTITYGLFAARTRSTENFNRKGAYDLIPPTIGILRDLFQFISLGKIPTNMEVIIDDIAEVLEVSDVNKILHQFYLKGKGEDPIIHFYETFLTAYDPTTREKRGVYYTPEPVVRFIVGAVHEILKSHFDFEDGLANKEVTLLDPAAGTLTFPAEAIKAAVKEYVNKYGDGGKTKFIRNQLLKNFYAFELMMAPYAIGHIKISFLLEELGYRLNEDDRFNLYLTNTLDMVDMGQTEIPGLGSLSEESHLAAKVKQKDPILVILGNPPYSGVSANINEWTEKLLKENLDGATSYYEVDGKPLGEKKLWLQDDYVKFLRFAQWKIHKAGVGIVAMITNHGYLDNPTFRGMRQSLMNTFNEIFILDLHGNGLKKETAPNGSKDENVFDIRQGVSIALLVKKKNKSHCKVYHSDLFGLRQDKYTWLDEHNFSPKLYKQLDPGAPWYFFVPRNTIGIESFNEWPTIGDIFPVNNAGIVTARDQFAIDHNEQALHARIKKFRDLTETDTSIVNEFGLKDTSTFKLKRFRQELSKVKNWEKFFLPILYRPFDKRTIYYSKWVVERPIYDTMKHMINIKGNLAITVGRQGQVVGKAELWNLTLVTDSIVDFNLYYRGGELFFPLYILPETAAGSNGDLFIAPKEGPQPNISEKIFKTVQKAYKGRVSPEQILSYVYAVLNSNVYRKKYGEFLKIDFPRIPFVADNGVFQKMSLLGKDLVDLHLLRHKSLSKGIVKYKGKGESDLIGKPHYVDAECRIYINEDKYFENVSEDIWSFHVGGYQVLEKYLKDRRGMEMEDPAHYIKIATTIRLTLEVQKEIDNLFPKVDKSVLHF